jgi:hypothetical protein
MTSFWGFWGSRGRECCGHENFFPSNCRTLNLLQLLINLFSSIIARNVVTVWLVIAVFQKILKFSNLPSTL